MAAPSTVTTNGVTPVGIGGLTGIVDETRTVGTTVTTIFSVEDFTFEPKRDMQITRDSDMAATMVKAVSPEANLAMKGKIKSMSASSLVVQVPGASITTTVSGGTLAIANFAAAGQCGFLPTDGLLILMSAKYNQKRLQTALEYDIAITHFPHLA
jgi:hypothetical protein